ncbi:MAG: N-acetyl-gamma-glutamyl-phosphate reductase [Candidatus Marinimicrobia bacterium]|nr:N-acetyl-gamma-glutamyl-phosphate reductase [Candidatus Neomarinimicrobiota bacterium]OUW50896.1 MAG: N-acetyl-gamma-glutamyl-phosphate reductase [bacterium TMED190]|tara:strand:+ start:37734 stop:38777 length:1044 start_codon:yes stop_codon:yes gene_type:complete
MSKKIKVGVVGGSGYTGGELLRILYGHPFVDIVGVTSRKYLGKPISRTHPNLRKISKLKFISIESMPDVDVLFLGLPHHAVMDYIDDFLKKTDLLIDLSSDFRLSNPDDYIKYYGHEHSRPELLKEFVYGMPELHREKIINSKFIAVPGCTATAAILPLKPIVDNLNPKIIVVDSKVGSSAAGAAYSLSTHHPERSNVVRSFKPSMHRHLAEMNQELNKDGSISLNFSPHAVEMIRGIQSTIHVFLDEDYTSQDIWQIYLQAYKEEPFIRLVREKFGIYRFPEPKLVLGTNICEIGFEKDESTGRLIIMSAIDNLMKGAAGQGVQSMNVALGFEETIGINSIGFHPV